MTKLLHIVGSQGSGKTTLALQLAQVFKAQGKTAIVPQDQAHCSLAEVLAMTQQRAWLAPQASALPQVDWLIIEHERRPTDLYLLRGDKVITIEVAE